MKAINNILIISGLIFIGQGLYAQNKNTNDDNTKKSFNESVIITTQFDPIVNEAFKINENPSIFDTTFPTPNFNYEIITKPFTTKYEIEPIKPAKVKGEPIAELYNTNIKAGIGTYLTPYLEGFYSETRNRTLLYNVHLRHYSSFWSLNDYATSHFANTDLDLFGKKIWDNFFVDAKVYYNNSINYYYGFNNDTIGLENKDYRNYWNNVGTVLNYGSLYRNDEALHHNVSFALNYLDGKWNNSELNMNIGADAYKRFELFYNDKQTIGLKINYNHTFDNMKSEYANAPYFFSDTLSNNNTNYNTGIVSIKPYFNFKINEFELHTALDFSPEFGNNSSFHFFPVAIVHFNIIPQQLYFKGGINGGVERKSLNNIRIENPYISPNVNLHSTSNYTFFGALNSTFIPNLDINIEVGYQIISNHQFFMLDPLAKYKNMYDIVYDKANRFYAKTQLGYFIDQEFSLIVNAMYQNIKTETLNYAYYQPDFTASISLQYIAAEKFIFNLAPTFKSGVKAYDLTQDITLKPIIDINLSAEYKYTKQLSFFVKLNNLAFQRYYEYYNYPSQRFMGMIGASMSF